MCQARMRRKPCAARPASACAFRTMLRPRRHRSAADPTAGAAHRAACLCSRSPGWRYCIEFVLRLSAVVDTQPVQVGLMQAYSACSGAGDISVTQGGVVLEDNTAPTGPVGRANGMGRLRVARAANSMFMLLAAVEPRSGALSRWSRLCQWRMSIASARLGGHGP